MFNNMKIISANEEWLKCNHGKSKTTVMVGVIRLLLMFPFLLLFS